MDFLLFYSHGPRLVQIGNVETGKSILKAIDPTITRSKIRNHYKNAACSTDFNLNLEDFSTLPRTVPVRNPVSFSKPIIKVVSASSICPGKPTCDSDVSPSKPVSAILVQTSKPISNSNVCPNKPVSASSVKPIFDSTSRASKPTPAINVRVAKPISENVRFVMYIKVNSLVVVMLDEEILLALATFV